MLNLVRKVVLAAGLGCLMGTPALAAAPEAPRGMVVAGSRIVAVDEARSFWVRGLGADDSWARVELSGNAKDAPAYGMACAQDGSGKCLLTAIRGELIRILYDTATGDQEILDLGQAETAIFANKAELYFTRPASGGGKDLFLYKLDSRTSVLLGTLAPTEIATYLAVEGTLRPIALDNSGKARALLGDGRSASVDMAYSDDMVMSKGEVLLPEGWGNDKPIIPGQQALSVMRLEPTGKTAPAIAATGKVIVTGAFDKNVFVSSSIRADANRDIVAQVASPQGRFIGLLCNADGGRGFGTFARSGLDSAVEIIGSDAGPGFIIRMGDALTTGRYRYLSFPPAGGFEDRKCQDVKLATVDLGITPRSLAADFEKVTGTAISADGTTVPYLLLRRRGEAPKSLILHVYGAYGRMVSPEPPTEHILSALKEHGTAVVMPMVRGDGNRGYRYGIASRPPNRMKAVEDVIAVAEKLAIDFPGLKPMVRGGSAGGWLAVRSALERPSLFSGAVGVSGAYTVSGLRAISSSNGRFFTPEDDLSLLSERLKAACPGLKVRLIHARDDWKLPYADAVKFAELVKAAGCPVELVTFDTGGHNIEIPIDQIADGNRMREAFYGPFAP